MYAIIIEKLHDIKNHLNVTKTSFGNIFSYEAAISRQIVKIATERNTN